MPARSIGIVGGGTVTLLSSQGAFFATATAGLRAVLMSRLIFLEILWNH
jgi:hypothetical protein